MKRDKYTYTNITKIYPIFLWKECRFCGKEFKKEYGFKITKENECQCFNENTKYNITYCCNDCCKDENEVIQRLAKESIEHEERVRNKIKNNLKQMKIENDLERICKECLNEHKGLTKEKKEILKENMGSASSKNIDLNKVKDDWKCRNIGSNPEPKTKRPGVPKHKKPVIPIVKEW